MKQLQENWLARFSREDYEVGHIISEFKWQKYSLNFGIFSNLKEGAEADKARGEKAEKVWKSVSMCSCCRQGSGVERGWRDVLQQLGDARGGLVRAVTKLLLLDPEQQWPVEAGVLQEPHTRRHLQEASRWAHSAWVKTASGPGPLMSDRLTSMKGIES